MKRLCVTAALVLVGYAFAACAAVSRVTPRTTSLMKRSGGARYHAEIRLLHEQRRRLHEQLQGFEQRLEALGSGAAAEKKEEEEQLQVALSTQEHPMSCRILIEAEPGAKVIAPCNCQGTLKVSTFLLVDGNARVKRRGTHAQLSCDEKQWIQFSEFNHLRRQEPEKWQVCSLCKAPFRTKQIYNDSGLVALALAAALDSPKLLRIATLSSLAALVRARRLRSCLSKAAFVLWECAHVLVLVCDVCGQLVTFRQLFFAGITWFITSRYLWQTVSFYRMKPCAFQG